MFLYLDNQFISKCPNILPFQLQSIASLNKFSWSKFELDNTAKVFRVFPNGIASMASIDYIYGDYIGEILNDSTINLKFYMWPKCLTKPIWSFECNISVVHSRQRALAYALKVFRYDDQLVSGIDYTTMDASSRIGSLNTSFRILVGHLNAIYTGMEDS